MTISTQSSHRRLSSLQAAGVSSSPSTTPVTTTTRKKAAPPLPDPVSTSAAARMAARRSSMGLTTTKKPASATAIKTPSRSNTRPVPSSSSTSATTQTVKKPTITPGTARRNSRLSTHGSSVGSRPGITSPTSPMTNGKRAIASNHNNSTNNSNIDNNSSSTKSLNSTIHSPPKRSAVSLAIEELKDKNNEIQNLLKQKEEVVTQKDTRLKELEGKLDKLQHELDEKSSALQEMSTKISNKNDSSATTLLEPPVTKDTQQQQQQLQQKMDAYETQIQETRKTLEKERLRWIQEHEDAEEKNRENMEKLREKLQSEKNLLNKTILEKERAQSKLQKCMDEMRDNIQEMHQSHQTRLTSLTNQLNQQHASLTDQLKLDYENQLKAMSEKHVFDQAEFQNQFNEKIQELEHRHLQIDASKNLENYQTELKEKLDALKKDHTNIIEQLKKDHSEIETKLMDEINNAQNELQMANKDKEELVIKQEKIQSLMSESKLSAVVDMANLRKNLENQHVTQLQQLSEQKNKEIEEIKALHKLELAKYDTDRDAYIALETEIQELKSTYKQKLSELNSALETESSKHRLLHETLQTKNGLLEKELEKIRDAERRAAADNDRANRTISSCQTEIETVSKDLEAEKTNYKTLMASYEEVIKVKQEDHQKYVELQNEMQALISHHKSTSDQLEKEHSRQLKAEQERNLSSQTEIEIALKQQFGSKIEALKNEKQHLRDELRAKDERLISSNQNMKNAELEYSARYQDLRNQLDEFRKIEAATSKENDEELRIQELKHHYEMSQLEEQLSKSQAKLKASQVQCDQLKKELEKSMANVLIVQDEVDKQRSNDSNELNTVKVFFENLLATKDKKLKQLKDQVQNRGKSETEAKLQGIIEQHQKELNTLQNQFQSLLDIKDKELKDLSYKLKTTNGSLSNQVEQELRAQLQTMEEDMKSKSLEMRWLESDSEQNETKLKEQGILVQKLQSNTAKLEKSIKRYKQENEHMLRLIHQLQGPQ